LASHLWLLPVRGFGSHPSQDQWIGVTGTLDYEDVSGRPWRSAFNLRNVDGVRYVDAKTPALLSDKI
jgi:hypothetical protein